MENQPKRWLEKLLESAVILALSAFLIKLALCWLYAVWPILVVIATVVAVGVVAYRIWRRKRDSEGAALAASLHPGAGLRHSLAPRFHYSARCNHLGGQGPWRICQAHYRCRRCVHPQDRKRDESTRRHPVLSARGLPPRSCQRGAAAGNFPYRPVS